MAALFGEIDIEKVDVGLLQRLIQANVGQAVVVNFHNSTPATPRLPPLVPFNYGSRQPSQGLQEGRER